MKLEELKNRLNQLEVPQNYYSFKFQKDWNVFYLLNKNNIWEFYYLDERGGKSDFQTFQNEENACDYFLQFMLKMKYEWSKLN